MYNAYYDRDHAQPKSCLQKYISLTSYFNLIISLVALAFAIYRSVKQSDVWNQSSFNWNSSVIGLLLIGSILLLLTSIIGIVGSRKRNKCCLFLFHIFSMVLALLFLAAGFIFVVVTAYANDNDNFNCSQGNNMEAFYYGQQAYDLAQPLLCSNSCKCNLSNPDVITSLQSTDPFMLFNIKSDGQTQVQGCSNFSNNFSNSQISNQVPWLKFLEEGFQCTGMCTKPKNVNAFFFSDINAGLPVQETCIIKFQNFLQSYGKLVYLIGLIVGFYLTFNALLSICLCCKRKQSGQSFRERLAPY